MVLKCFKEYNLEKIFFSVRLGMQRCKSRQLLTIIIFTSKHCKQFYTNKYPIK